MIMRKLPHKDVLNPPGQFKNEVKDAPGSCAEGFDRYPYIPKTLGNMIDSVKKHEEMLMNEKKKMTFEQWFGSYDLVGPTYYDDLKACWKAAQENK